MLADQQRQDVTNFIPDVWWLKKIPNKIVLLGFGVENQQFLDWLLKVVLIPKSKIVVFDAKQIPDDKLDGVELVFGVNYLLQLVSMQSDIGVVFKTPGIWSLKPELEYLRGKRGLGFIQSPLVFFLNKFQSQIVGVTGTKGKSTTANFLLQLLNSQLSKNLKAIYCGNTTGISPYQYWQNLEPNIDENLFFVIELSSFQLQDLGYAKISPKYSIITNIYIDHLDQHNNPQEYWQAKQMIFEFQPDPGLIIATTQVLEKTPLLQKIHNKILFEVDKVDSYLHQEVLQALSSANILGLHNRINLLLAYYMTLAITENKFNQQEIEKTATSKLELFIKVIKDLKMLPKRLQLVKTKYFNGVKVNFFDDGVATQPDAVCAGIRGVMESDKNSMLWLQLSGIDKGSDLTNLILVLKELAEQKRIFRIDFFGQVGLNIKNKLELETKILDFEYSQGKLKDFLVSGFGSILNKLNHSSHQTLNVLFSPAGSSFDEFINYHQRSQLWLEAVDKC